MAISSSKGLCPRNALLQVLLIFVASVSALDVTEYFGSSLDKSTYLDWVQKISYDRAAFLSSESNPDMGVALHWSTDSTHIHLAVAARASGWVGFGMAESGGMRGADIILFTAENNKLLDTHVLDQLATPIKDECQSWTLTNSITSGDDGFIIFEASRLLDTGDSQDRPIINDASTLVPPARVIAAWGDNPTPTYHGIENRARSSLRFFGPEAGKEADFFSQAMETEAEASFTMTATDFAIPRNETVYQDFCFSAQDLIAEGVPLEKALHTIGIEPLVDSRSRKYVHHFTLSGSTEPWDPSTDECEMFPGIELAYVWAPGDEPLNMPPNVGQPLGVAGFQSFKLEIHYNNPWHDEGNIDSSGLRFYYTSQKREMDMGVFQTGDAALSLYGEPVAVSDEDGLLAQHSFTCSGGCSEGALKEPVTVFREHLHMHKSGASMQNLQIRNGEVVRKGEVQFWDFDQQGNMAVLQESFTIHAGDGFKTYCNYSPSKGEIFGLSSQEEMCIAFLFYFPRQMMQVPFLGEAPFMCDMELGNIMPECGVEHSKSTVNSAAALGRKFGSAPMTCPAEDGGDAPSFSPTINDSDDESSGHTLSVCIAAAFVAAFAFFGW